MSMCLLTNRPLVGLMRFILRSKENHGMIRETTPEEDIKNIKERGIPYNYK